MTLPTWSGRHLAESPEAESVWRLGPVRLGYIDYLNCLPVYYGIEQGIIDLPVAVKKGTPARMNRMFADGLLDIAPISSIGYAQSASRSVVLPDLSISADGRVASILLFTKRGLRELDGRPVALTSTSATSVVLTKVLLQEQYGARPRYVVMDPDLDAMLREADAALMIGDDALLARQSHPHLPCFDLGQEWKELTGLPMVFALWVADRAFAERNPEGVRLAARLLGQSQAYSWAHRSELIDEAMRRRNLPRAVIEEYFSLIRHELTDRYREGLRLFLETAWRLGELDRVPELAVWGEL
jgi:chorismate dehydratase